MNFFIGIFQRFCLLFRYPYLKGHVYFNRDISQGSTSFLGKYYSRECLNGKISHTQKYFKGNTYFLEEVLIY